MICQLRKASVLGFATFLTLAAGRPLAMADVPPALDRVPADAGVVIAIPNITKLHDAMAVLEDTFQFKAEETPLGEAMKLFDAAGLKKDGSMAMAVMFPVDKEAGKEGGDEGKDKAAPAGDKGADADGEKEGDKEGPGDADGDDDAEANEDGQPIAVLVVPVTDYKAFVKGLNGDPAAAIAEVHPGDDKEMYAKDIGGGFAALSDNSDALGTFSGKAGSLAAYKSLLGKSGVSLVESSDFAVVANIQILAPKIKEGVGSMRQTLEAVGQANGAAASGMAQAFSDAVTTDGKSAMLGFDVEPDGLRVETAATFKEGSPSAAVLQTVGKASGLLASLPAVPQGFLFAGAMDSSAPGMKKILENYATAETKAAMAAAESDLSKWTNKSEGSAGIIGTSPALIGGPGFFVNSMLFAKSSNAASLIGDFKQAMSDANGKTQNGVTVNTNYKAGSATIAGTPVDEWQVGIKTDPNSPSAGQSQMVMATLFGPKGSPSGYVGAAKSGVVMTLSKNSALMESALKAANGDGPSFASDPGVKAVSGKLPDGRTFEGYVGVKDILNMVLPLAAMAGVGPIQVDIPSDLQPIGLGGTSRDGTMRVSTFVPTDVLKTFAALAKELNHSGQDGEAPADGGNDAQQNGGRPRF